MDCDSCRNGARMTPEAIRAFAGEWGLRRTPIPFLEEIRAHVARRVGPVSGALVLPDFGPAPFDILIVEPAPDRPFTALVTAGVSAVAMTPPSSAPPSCRRVEFAILLPPDWGLSRADRGDERRAWPLALLIDLGRRVGTGQAWFWCRHTYEVADGPLVDGSPYPALLLSHSAVLDPDFSGFDRSDGEYVHFLSVWPLHRSECAFACRSGLDRLLDRLSERGVTDILDERRPPVAKAR